MRGHGKRQATLGYTQASRPYTVLTVVFLLSCSIRFCFYFDLFSERHCSFWGKLPSTDSFCLRRQKQFSDATRRLPLIRNFTSRYKWHPRVRRLVNWCHIETRWRLLPSIDASVWQKALSWVASSACITRTVGVLWIQTMHYQREMYCCCCFHYCLTVCSL